MTENHESNKRHHYWYKLLKRGNMNKGVIRVSQISKSLDVPPKQFNKLHLGHCLHYDFHLLIILILILDFGVVAHLN